MAAAAMDNDFRRVIVPHETSAQTPMAELLRRARYQGDPLGDSAVRSLRDLPDERRRAIVARAIRDGHRGVRDVPSELAALFDSLEETPSWLEPPDLATGGRLFYRAGCFSFLSLATASLPIMYTSSAGAKPLARTGCLLAKAYRRLSETNHFVMNVCSPGGMLRDGPGFASAVRVRLMHAQVRAWLEEKHWDTPELGVPINQADMLATMLSFCHVMTEALSAMGFAVSDEERASFRRLWGFTGGLMGVERSLVERALEAPGDVFNAWLSVQPPPDGDCQGLARALVDLPTTWCRNGWKGMLYRRFSRLLEGLTGALLGHARATSLGLNPDLARRSLGLVRAAVSVQELGWTYLLRSIVLKANRRIIQAIVRRGLAGSRPSFDFTPQPPAAAPLRLPSPSSAQQEVPRPCHVPIATG